MKKNRYQLVPLILLLLATAVSLLYLVRHDYQAETRVFAELPSAPIPSPTPIPPGPLKTDEMLSPDGTQTLTMNYQQTGDSKRYTFFTSGNEDPKNKVLLFSQTLDAAQALSIPFNTWSPDNKYLYLRKFGAAQENFYVFSASGKKFVDDADYLDIQALFAEKVDGYNITDVTGWATPELLLVNAQATDGDQKVSFWFDVTSRSFIRLSTYFF